MYIRRTCEINRTRLVPLAGTREAAFVHALSAAALAHEVTRACSQGRLPNRCGCDLSVNGGTAEGFKWSGCSDNLAYGVAFSKSFVDARDVRAARSTASPKALVNLHNNDVGRKVGSPTNLLDNDARQPHSIHTSFLPLRSYKNKNNCTDMRSVRKKLAGEIA